jgi:hypothetical protein
MNRSRDGRKPSNFWTTIPGILTGLAALITAIAGLLTVLPKTADTPTSLDQVATTPEATPPSSESGPSPISSPGPSSTTPNPLATSSPLQDSPADASPLANPQTQASDIEGNWEWIHTDSQKVADISFSQRNGEYWGEVRYTNPAPGGAKQARMKGTFDGQTYTFVWWFGTNPNGDQNNPPGRAFLSFVDDGQTLEGRFTDDPSDPDKYPWELRRAAI